MSNQNTHQVTLTISEQMWKWLKIYAIENETSASAIIRRLIADLQKTKGKISNEPR